MFLHGSGGSCVSWWQNIDSFSSDTGGNWFVIVMSLRSWGGSVCDRPTDLDPAYFGSDVIAVMDAEGVVEAALVAQSFGGWFAVCAAAMAPERISCIVMSNTICGLKEEDGPLGDYEAYWEWSNEKKLQGALRARSIFLEMSNLDSTAVQGFVKRVSLDFDTRIGVNMSFCGPSFNSQNPRLFYLYQTSLEDNPNFVN
jgi:pimeloyl-ACP methyl ester carboxylesterase